MTRSEGRNPLSSDVLIEIRTQELVLLTEHLKKGTLPKNVFLNRVHEILSELDLVTKSEERRHLNKIGLQSGIESLGTDDRGNRSEKELAENGRAFATGVASRCLAVAVVHPDVGVGAAHTNPVSSTATIEYLSRRIDNEPVTLDLLFSIDPDRVMQIVGEERLRTATRTTINHALSEFRNIQDGPQYIPSNTSVHLTGLNFITPSIKEGVLRTALETLHQVVQEQQQGTGRRTNIQISEHLMEDGGTIYGGKNHPEYNVPSYYRLT